MLTLSAIACFVLFVSANYEGNSGTETAMSPLSVSVGSPSVNALPGHFPQSENGPDCS